MNRYDAIVAGLGAMGSAAAWQLASRGANVLGVDRYRPPHPFGSSHGDTRITRLAIGEGSHLSPLAIRSHEIWREIERESSAKLLMSCGGLVISSAGKTSFTHVEGFFANTVAAARKFGIAHELLDASAIRARFPPFKVRDAAVGYFERDAGYVRVEDAIATELKLAALRGATLRTDEQLVSFADEAGGVTVETTNGRYQADRLILTLGAWLPAFLDERLKRLFRVHRQVLYWFALDGRIDAYEPTRFPIFIWELPGESQGIYGFPAVDGARGGLKIATETYDEPTSADTLARNVGADEIASMHQRLVAPYLEGVSARAVKTVTCLYTVTPDFGFIIDWLPGSKRVLVCSACSGHGFKHSPAIGETLADLVTGQESRFDLAPFRFARFEAA